MYLVVFPMRIHVNTTGCACACVVIRNEIPIWMRIYRESFERHLKCSFNHTNSINRLNGKWKIDAQTRMLHIRIPYPRVWWLRNANTWRVTYKQINENCNSNEVSLLAQTPDALYCRVERTAHCRYWGNRKSSVVCYFAKVYIFQKLQLDFANIEQMMIGRSVDDEWLNASTEKLNRIFSHFWLRMFDLLNCILFRIFVHFVQHECNHSGHNECSARANAISEFEN